MLPDANTGRLCLPLDPPAVLLTPGKVAVGGDQTCQTLRLRAKRVRWLTET